MDTLNSLRELLKETLPGRWDRRTEGSKAAAVYSGDRKVGEFIHEHRNTNAEFAVQAYNAMPLLLGAVDVLQELLEEYGSGLLDNSLWMQAKEIHNQLTGTESEFEFTVTLSGRGMDREEAWQNAVAALEADPGEPETYKLVIE